MFILYGRQGHLRTRQETLFKTKEQQFQLLGNLLKSMKLEGKRCESINIKPIRRNTDYIRSNSL